MATTTDTPEEVMNPKRWFEEGGQMAELQRIGKIKNPEQYKEALEQFNDRNTALLAERDGPAQPPPLPQRPGKAETHPAIEEAINEAMKKETGWMSDMAGRSDDQLRDRRLSRLMEQDRANGRLAPGIQTLTEYKESRPTLVEAVGADTRKILERKETLSRMVRERGFSVIKAKVDWERKQNPEMVKTAELNLAQDGLSPNSARFNDQLYREVGQVKKTLGNAKTAGFKI